MSFICLCSVSQVLSPYLKFGCLSAVRFFHALDAVVAKGRHTEPPVSLHGQVPDVDCAGVFAV